MYFWSTKDQLFLTPANPFQEQHQRRSVGCGWSNILYMNIISHPLKYLQT